MLMQEQSNEKQIEQLCKAFACLGTEEDCAAFLEDICTVKEIKIMCQRLEVARLLEQGEKYQAIAKETGASSTTVSRVNRYLKYGSGGYKKVLKELKKNER